MKESLCCCTGLNMFCGICSGAGVDRSIVGAGCTIGAAHLTKPPQEAAQLEED